VLALQRTAGNAAVARAAGNQALYYAALNQGKVRWYIVTGAGGNTNVTGHRWKNGKDTDKGKRTGGGLAAEKTQGNVFNYHVSFNS